MRARVWMMVCVVAGMMSCAGMAHAAGAGKFSCAAPDAIAFQVVSYDVSVSQANGRTSANISMRAPKANKQKLMSYMTLGKHFVHCKLGPVGGGAGTYTVTAAYVTSLNDVVKSGGQAGKSEQMVDVKMSCDSATLGGGKKK